MKEGTPETRSRACTGCWVGRTLRQETPQQVLDGGWEAQVCVMQGWRDHEYILVTRHLFFLILRHRDTMAVKINHNSST